MMATLPFKPYRGSYMLIDGGKYGNTAVLLHTDSARVFALKFHRTQMQLAWQLLLLMSATRYFDKGAVVKYF